MTQNTNETNTNATNNTVPPLYENMRVGDKVSLSSRSRATHPHP